MNWKRTVAKAYLGLLGVGIVGGIIALAIYNPSAGLGVLFVFGGLALVAGWAWALNQLM